MSSPSPSDRAPAPAQAQRWALRWTEFDLPPPSPVEAATPGDGRQRAPSGLRLIEGGASATATTMIGGRYEVLAELGRGAVGEVFEVRHRISGRRGVLKVLSARATRHPDQVRRFEREFRLLHHLDHPGILRVLDYDVTAEGRPFIVMEHLLGRDLKKVLEEEGPMSVERAVAVAEMLCDAVIALHAAGILHRDIKPGNILVVEGDREQIKLFDLGASKCTRAYYAVDRPYMTPPELRSVTDPGVILATAGYDAPELAVRGSSVQQDVYALGVVIFKMLSGQMPMRALRTADGYDERFDAVDLPGPRELADAVRLAMHPDPDRRYRDVGALREEIAMVAEMLRAEAEEVRSAGEGRGARESAGSSGSNAHLAGPSAPPRSARGTAPSHEASRRRRWWSWIVVGVVLVQALWIGALYRQLRSSPEDVEVAPVAIAEELTRRSADSGSAAAMSDREGLEVSADESDASAIIEPAIPAAVDDAPARPALSRPQRAPRRTPAAALPDLEDLRRCLAGTPAGTRISIDVEVAGRTATSVEIAGATTLTEQCLRGRLARLSFPAGPRHRTFVVDEGGR